MRTEPDPYEEHERYLLEMLDILRRQYELAAKPYIDELVRYRSMRPGTIIVDVNMVPGIGIQVLPRGPL